MPPPRFARRWHDETRALPDARALRFAPDRSCEALQRLHRQRHAVMPDLLDRVHDRVPLAALLGELRPALGGDAVVLAPPLAGHRLPARLRVAEALEAVQQRV